MASTNDTTKLTYPWVLWYHDPEKTDWSEKSYIQIADVNTVQQFWTVINNVPLEAWQSGMFFFMRKGFRPLWDAKENESGGAWSKKLEAIEAPDLFIDLMVHCIASELMVDRKETLVGISISPKGPFSIVKIWNTTTSVSHTKYLNSKIHKFPIDDTVTYTAHKSRPR
jgi:hypothetical protein